MTLPNGKAVPADGSRSELSEGRVALNEAVVEQRERVATLDDAAAPQETHQPHSNHL